MPTGKGKSWLRKKKKLMKEKKGTFYINKGIIQRHGGQEEDIKERHTDGDSLAVQWLGHCAFIPGIQFDPWLGN